MGKNQEKRRQKSITHAHKVWVKKQLTAAKAWETISAAEELFYKNTDELTPEQVQEVEEQISAQREHIREYVLKGKEDLVVAIGEEEALRILNLE